MSERVNLVIDDGVSAMLLEMAGSERKRGAWISQMVRAMYAQERDATGTETETLRLGFAGLAGMVKQIDARLMKVEGQLSAMMANQR